MASQIRTPNKRPYDEAMSAAGRYLSQRHQRLVPAYLAAIILGIVGMHVLMQHCPTPAHAMSASSSSTTMSHHIDDTVMAATSATDAADSFVEAVGQSGGSLDDMLMLCAALMLGAGALLTLLLVRRDSRPVALIRLRPTLWRPLLALAGTGPPPTLAFTVIRC